MNEVWAALIGLISSAVVSILSIYGAKKLGIGASQGQLVTTLKDLSSAQDMRIDQLEARVLELEKEGAEKDKKIASLESTVLKQALALNKSGGTA